MQFSQTIASVSLVLALSTLASAQDSAAPPPPDAPPRGLRVNEAGAFDGYTLFSPLRSGSTFLIDMKGEVVHRWETGIAPGNMAYLLDDGHLLRGTRIDDNPRFFGGGISGRIQELDWDGKVLWDWSLSTEQRMLHHDIEVMPNGHLLVIAWDYVSREDALALGRDPKGTSEKGWWPDAVLEVEIVRPSSAKIVWEWRALDHLIQDLDRAKPNFGSISDHPELFDINADTRNAPPMTKERREALAKRDKEMKELGYTGGDEPEDAPPKKDERPPDPDWMHSNGLDYLPELDLIVVSANHACEIFVLDHSTTSEQARGHSGGRWGKGGDLLYRWGSPAHYGMGERDEQTLFHQHDPQWLAGAKPGELRLTLFNNGQDRPGGEYSSVDELVLPFDRERGFLREKGKPFGPAAPAWSYAAPDRKSMYSFFISGAQRLPNGNTLICVGATGRFLEVTPDQRIVWEYWNPLGGELEHGFGKAGGERKSPVEPYAVFQATRIGKEHPGLRGRTLTADAKR